MSDSAVRSDFSQTLSQVRHLVDTELGTWLSARLSPYHSHGSEAFSVAESVVDLTMRGGKRIRAGLAGAAFSAYGGGDVRAVRGAYFALELMQTYLLIHDDWMDQDPIRRGAPSVHEMLRKRFQSTMVGDSAAILAGDLASALSQEALLESNVPKEHLCAALRVYSSMQREVVYGQIRDVCGKAANLEEVEQTYALKTGSYTVLGPLLLGAALAGRDAEAELRPVSRSLGVAFQLRDDVLGTFGDESKTGKPIVSDLRQRKRTSLIVLLEETPDGREFVRDLFSQSTFVDSDAYTLRQKLIESGTLDRLERRIAEVRSETHRLSEGLPEAIGSLIRSTISIMVDRSA